MQRAPRHLQHRLHLHILGLAHAVYGAEILFAGGKQAGEIAEAEKQVARQIHRAFADHAGAQEDRQQLGIGKRGCAALDQFFARTFALGPVIGPTRPLDRKPTFLAKMHSIMEQERNAKRIVLGLTGGIAAYKAAELTRLLIKQGIEVQVAMTEAACHFITPPPCRRSPASPVLTNQWDASDNGMAHIDASRAADAIVIAPATADFIAKLAHGLADDLLSTLCLARDCPLLVAPAMNRQMWENAATQRNVAQLRARRRDDAGARPAGCRRAARRGWGGCWRRRRWRGDCGISRGNELLTGAPSPQPSPGEREPGQRMDGVRVLITAGPTYEADRRGARHHQPQLGQDGLCGCAGRAGAGCRGDAGFRPGGAG